MKRRDEITMLVKYANKIKKYIKEHKNELIKGRSENERKIFEIQVSHNPLLKENLSRKNSSLSATYLNDSDDSILMSIPDERDWKKDLHELRLQVADFNLVNYSYVLSEGERFIFDKVIKKIPEQCRVYMQQ